MKFLLCVAKIATYCMFAACGSVLSDERVEMAEKPQAAETTRLPLKELRAFTQVFEQIRVGYVDEVEDVQLLENAIVGLLLELDPHSAYLNSDAYAELQENASGHYGGLGIEISAEQGLIKVIAPIDDSPAKKVGIEAGDLIVEIDGQPVRGLALPKAIDKLRGEKGSTIEVGVYREGEDGPLTFTLIRDIIYSSAVRNRYLKPGIGYIRIAQFQEKSGRDFTAALQKLKNNGPDKDALKGLVIDLRNNPGGLVPAAVQVADALLDSGTIVYTEGRMASANHTFNATPGDILEGTPIVVLINGGSASASEIVAGALQDHSRAAIVGTQSFGKGSVQTVIPLNDGRAVKLTTARYFTPKGRSIQAQGIQPDIILPRAEMRLFSADRKIRESDLAGHLQKTPEQTHETTEKAEDLSDDNQLQEAVYILEGFNLLNRHQSENPR
ncbi:MAG TPA: peptidase S41 [Porticoccaceae bacterium]|mgnify:CR=1 FL=1|nr:peptidase S41 [Porticoccaceae bacterium]